MFRLARFVRPYWRVVLLSCFFALLASGLQIAGPYFVKLTIDRYISHADYAGIARMSAYYMATVFGLFALEYMQGYFIAYVGQHAMFDMRREIFAHVQKLSLSYFDRNPVGRLMTRITSDVAALNELFSQSLVTFVGGVFLLFAITIMMLRENVLLTMMVFVTAPFLLYTGYTFRRKVRESYSQVRNYLARMNAYLQENLSGMRTVQAYNRQERNFTQFRELSDKYRAANMDSVFYHAIFLPAIEVISSISMALLIWYGGRATLGNSTLPGAITLGTVYLFVQYAQRFFQPIKDLGDSFNVFQTAIVSADRVFKLLDTRPQIEQPGMPVRLPHFEREIRFEDVWFAYKDEDFVLRDVNFTVQRGETVALVGSTGSGKTTITNLLARFYDVTRGRITIDGHDIRSLDMFDLRRQMAIVLQDVFLFTGDIAENIRLGNDSITDEDIQRCAQYVNASSFIEALPRRYHDEVRERGATFSVGQKQLLAFARALAFDPAILILDEATASIDTETELLIQDALHKLMQGRTSIVIAHRLSTIQNADKIIVLHHGKIREAGTHNELLQKDGIYRKLFELQYRGMETVPNIATS